ncbi:hypothetical protein KFE25_007156 [Diacronema lutheri]|uniref:Uncharacterized protein n=1 Tax=Diacronema lutheri TaxID=2081491 RepID=A0A8J5XQ35_DIALT|nr:hypothetical protein KFE25_007156 [Diacronema lutheri]
MLGGGRVLHGKAAKEAALRQREAARQRRRRVAGIALRFAARLRKLRSTADVVIQQRADASAARAAEALIARQAVEEAERLEEASRRAAEEANQHAAAEEGAAAEAAAAATAHARAAADAAAHAARRAEELAKEDAEARAVAEADIVAHAEAKARADAQAKAATLAEARAKSEAQAAAHAQAEAQAAAHAEAEAAEQAKAEASAAAAEATTEAARREAAERERARAAAQARADAEGRARAEAEARAAAREVTAVRARAEAEVRARAAEQATARAQQEETKRMAAAEEEARTHAAARAAAEAAAAAAAAAARAALARAAGATALAAKARARADMRAQRLHETRDDVERADGALAKLMTAQLLGVLVLGARAEGTRSRKNAALAVGVDLDDDGSDDPLMAAAHALLAIQRVARGLNARARTRRARLSRLLVGHAAARVLQMRQRGRFVWLLFQRQRRAALTLQARGRHRARLRAKAADARRRRIARARLRLAARAAARRRLASKQAAVVRLQAAARARAARRERARRQRRVRERRAATRIQTAARGRAARRAAALQRRVRAYAAAAARRTDGARRSAAVDALRHGALEAVRHAALCVAAEEACLAALGAQLGADARLTSSGEASAGWHARQAARDALDGAHAARVRAEEAAFLKGAQHAQASADARLIERPADARRADAAPNGHRRSDGVWPKGDGVWPKGDGVWPKGAHISAASGRGGGAKVAAVLGDTPSPPMPLSMHVFLSARQPANSAVRAMQSARDEATRVALRARVRLTPSVVRYCGWDGSQWSAAVHPTDEAVRAGARTPLVPTHFAFRVALGAGEGTSAVWHERHVLRWADACGRLYETKLRVDSHGEYAFSTRAPCELYAREGLPSEGSGALAPGAFGAQPPQPWLAVSDWRGRSVCCIISTTQPHELVDAQAAAAADALVGRSADLAPLLHARDPAAAASAPVLSAWRAHDARVGCVPPPVQHRALARSTSTPAGGAAGRVRAIVAGVTAHAAPGALSAASGRPIPARARPHAPGGLPPLPTRAGAQHAVAKPPVGAGSAPPARAERGVPWGVDEARWQHLERASFDELVAMTHVPLPLPRTHV